MRASDFGLEVQGTSAGQELVKCPWHDDHKASAWFEPNKGLFYCAVCGVGYNSSQLAKKLNIDYEEIRWGDDEDEIVGYNLLEEPVVSLVGMDCEGHPYIKSRKISPMIARRYGINYSPIHKAIVFPVHTLTGREIGHVKRYIDPGVSGTRYRVMGRLTPVWPMNFLMTRREPYPIIITEGPFSAMRINTVMYENFNDMATCLALFGAKSNSLIVNCLSGLDEQVVFLYDKDEAGKRACRKMRTLMPYAHSFVLPKSPDDMNDAEVLELLSAISQLGGCL